MNADYLFHFACFRCRRCFKRSVESNELTKVCPHCAGAAIRLGRHFKAPKLGDLEQWEKVRFLVEHGFLFQRLYDRANGGQHVEYPSSRAEAENFVERYKELACEEALPEIQAALRE